MTSSELPRAASEPSLSGGPKAALARAIPRRRRVTWWMGLVLAVAFALLVTPAVNAQRLFAVFDGGHAAKGSIASITVRAPLFASYDTHAPEVGHLGGGIVIQRGQRVTQSDEARLNALESVLPGGPVPYLAYGLLACALAALFVHHLRRSTYGRLLRVQLVNLGLLVAVAAAVKATMLTTSVSILAVPVALFAIIPTLALDRVVGLATGVLAALVVSLLVPFDVGVVCILLVQAGTAGLVVAERPKARWRATLVAGAASTVLTTLTYPVLVYLTTWHLPLGELSDPLHSGWIATAIGSALATVLAVPLLPLYQLAVGEITHGRLVHLEDLSHPLLRQIAERAPGTWQHSLMMANLAEQAANAIGADGRLVRVGAYFHDLGKSLSPKYFIENLDPGETSPHDQLPPQASCDAIFAHVTEGIATARRAGIHERLVDFMHMHHGNGVLEYFWAKCTEQGNPLGLTVDAFRYPGVPPQSRETAILAICDAVEAASRTLKKGDPKAIDTLVQRIVYGKLHLGQLDDSGLSMGDLRRIADTLRDVTRHANHGRIEYPWQKAQQDASTPGAIESLTSTGPRLDSLDRPAKADPVRSPAPAAGSLRDSQEAYADTGAAMTPKLRVGKAEASASASSIGILATAPVPVVESPPAERGISAPAIAPPAPRPPEPAISAEAAQFAAEAKETLREVTKETIAAPAPGAAIDAVAAVGSAAADVAAPPAAARKRAATIPPLRRPPTMPPPSPKTTLAGPLSIKPPARKPEAEDAAITQPRLPRPGDDAVESAGDETRPRLVLPARPSGAGLTLAERIDAQLEDDDEDAQLDEDFGSDTPVSAPSRAEIQALLGTAPDPTRVQSLEEIERLKGASDARRSDQDLGATRRASHPTAEVDEGDIEAAIELAPPARRSSLGVAKKKPGE